MWLICVVSSRSHFRELDLVIHYRDLVFVCFKDAVRLMDEKFLMNYARLHEVIYMYAFAEVGPCAYNRYDSHGRSSPDAGRYALVTAILPQKNRKCLVDIR